MDIRTAYDHGVARGIMRYAREQGTWRLFGQGWTLNRIRDLSAWDGHGVITRVHHAREVAALLALRVPVVDVCRTSPHPKVHSAANDDEETGQVVGRYFVGAGYRRFAYGAAADALWSQRRGHGFATALGIAEERLPTFVRPERWWNRPGAPRALKDWLRQLERPVAIFAGNDAIGLKLTTACAQLGLRVPGEVAVIGVDNEELLCEFSNPPLSSIPCNTERMGYEAARMLDRLMDRDQPPARAQHVAVPPLPIVVRGSSDPFVTADEAVRAALRCIHQRGAIDLRVPAVVAASGLSRRALESRFRRELSRSILDEIRRVRLESACHALATSTRPVGEIALASGFRTAQRFHQVFREHLGMPPAAYRKHHRGPSAAPRNDEERAHPGPASGDPRRA